VPFTSLLTNYLRTRGVQEDGEREAMLAFMSGKQELLPLVHTLLYLEETLEMRGGS
tara:strand:- start:277 stop:444 length:168 start_codon:yes stop_codon:yes gene_type:complete